jgi:hypothetical protein
MAADCLTCLPQDSHTAEYFGIAAKDILSDYETARQASGGITAAYKCLASLETQAEVPGSLERMDDCSVITFVSERPAAYDLPVPLTIPLSGEALTQCGYMGCVFSASIEGVMPASTSTAAPFTSIYKTLSAVVMTVTLAVML